VNVEASDRSNSLPSSRNEVSTFSSWAQLVRLPNVFTAIADVLAGAALAGALSQNTISQSWPTVLYLVIIVIALYWTGMIWNDINDLEQDRNQQRQRPLSDGRISIKAARNAAWMLLGVAILTAIGIGMNLETFRTLVDVTYDDIEQIPWTLRFGPLVVTAGLASCIRLYNSRLKMTLIGPLLMGLCRSGSMLLGISAGCCLGFTDWTTLPHGWIAVLGHGIYTAGFTWSARREAEVNLSRDIAAGWVVAAFGLGILSLVPWFAPSDIPLRINAVPSYPIVFTLMAMPLIRRAFFSVVDPTPRTIQLAIKQAILSIIFFDAILGLQFGGPWSALAICSLVIPSLILGKYFRST